MGYRKYIAALFLCLFVYFAKAQELTYQQVDSISNQEYLNGDWKQLIAFGNKAIANQIDFPKLRLRMGYAHFSSGSYSGALEQYQHVIAKDSHNDTAHYFSYLSDKYLNRDAEAFYHASYLDTAILRNEKISSFGLVQAGIESGVKVPGNKYRSNATYSRVSISNRLGMRVVLDQSLAYFDQPITFRRARRTEETTDRQKEYYGKVSYAFLNKLLFIGAYHYFNTSYEQTEYRNNAGFTGIKYVGSYFDAQAGVDFSHINGDNYMQYDGKFSIYPFGNLNLYTISSLSTEQGTGRQYIFCQLAGFKALNNLWFEGSATFGKLNNYFEYDALYIYNAIDETTFKAGAILYYQLSKHALIYLNDTFEKKSDVIESIRYNQNSITGGVTWKF